MAKLRDLALRPDFKAGPLCVSPARRRITGPGGEAQLEPLIMHVLLLLLDSGGRVVTREELFDHCWGGVMVGDDSLNRAVGKVRKTTGEVAPGAMEIETIPRTGYRVTGEIPDRYEPVEESAGISRGLSRRAVVGSAAAAALALGGAGLWAVQSRRESRFDALLNKGVQGLEYGDSFDMPVVPSLREAVAVRPDDPRAQGLLAYALMSNAESVFNRGGAADVENAAEAAGRALAIDPLQPEALLARITLERSVLDMAGTETRIRDILSKSPGNFFAMLELWNVLQCGGRSNEALALVDQVIARKPLAASANYPRAQLLWITGRIAEADRVIDTAMRYWPTHRYVRFARFMIFAFTGRPRAALAMLDDPDLIPQNFSDASVALWRVLLPALQSPSASATESAHKASIEGTAEDPKVTAQAVMTLSVLGDLDGAFEIANKLLLFRHAADSKTTTGATALPVSTAWRFTPWLFTPPCAAMRLDPRFSELSNGIGLNDYWRKRGVRPDAFLFAR